jgi:hypothetical protein
MSLTLISMPTDSVGLQRFGPGPSWPPDPRWRKLKRCLPRKTTRESREVDGLIIHLLKYQGEGGDHG